MPTSAWADYRLIGDDARLLGTGGVSQIDGAGGGGLAVWALITGYAGDDSVGLTLRQTQVALGDYTLSSPGLAIGVWDRLEVSYAAQFFTVDSGRFSPLGLRQGFQFRQDIAGVKLKLFGDAIYDQDNWWPQVAIGLQAKHNADDATTAILGAREPNGFDAYVVATKYLIKKQVLVSGAIRLTNANQFGLLGFGGPHGSAHTAQFEGSLVYFLNRHWVIGTEIRTKPNNLSAISDTLRLAPEGLAYDVFASVFLSKFASLTCGYVNLGRVGDISLSPLGLKGSTAPGNQAGAYVSVQISL